MNKVKKVRLTSEQKKALEAYNFILAQEDRYLASVFANKAGEEKYDAKRTEAYKRCLALGMDHRHGL